ncbi:MAG: TonB-dependent receptor [Saprospiraceae bacterium]|nr:TonB-dependent receptor [Saprospiraceae bacterium]
MMNKLLLLVILTAFTGGGVFSQSLTQTLRGRITDADTRQPLAGATVALPGTEWGSAADSAGYYRIERVPVGRYRVQVAHVGYQSLLVAEVVVVSGKELVLDFALQEAPADLSEIVVRAPRSDARSYSPTVRTLTVEETLRFPATFFDPARLAMAFAGVASDNDQANGIAIRGNSPNGLLWRLEDVDIVNPNHTPNAGTFSDRVTANGGGVMMLSAQLLAASDFYTGAFPTGYGNALSGVMDMRLRRGNDQRHEFTAQAGLIGLDLAAEGPLARRSGASYLVNYRYSTLGLLSAMGLELGDEAISFQDFSFNLVFPSQKGGQWTLFGVGGLSENLFEAQRDSTLWEFQKDRYDITFRSRMGTLGASYTAPVGAQGVWRTVVAISALDSDRLGDRLDDSLNPQRLESDEYGQSKVSLHSYYTRKLGAGSRLRVGMMAGRQHYEIFSVVQPDTLAEGSGGGLLLQPYAHWQTQLGSRLRLNAGLHGLYFDFNGTGAVEPRLSAEWTPAPRQTLALSYGLHSQLQQPQLYFSANAAEQNAELTPSRAHHVVLSYEYQLPNQGALRAEAFFQHLFNVPISTSAGNTFSALNLVETAIDIPLVNEGLGRNYGLELNWQQLFTGSWYYLLNATFYDSKYRAADGLWRNTRYNGNYLFNATAGREWKKQREGRGERTLGANARLACAGGFRDTPIDAEASAAAGVTVYRDAEAFSLKQTDYYRLDLRIYLQWQKKKANSTLSLDIQNATNAKNTAFSYYDTQQKAIVIKRQLGIIPILSWRVEF